MIISSLPTIKELKIISVFKKEKLSRTYKETHQKNVVYKIKDHVLLYLIVIVILKGLITNLKEVLFNN